MGVATAMACAQLANKTSPGSFMDTRHLLRSSSLQIMSHYFGIESSSSINSSSNSDERVMLSSILRIVVGLVAVILVAQVTKTMTSSLLCTIARKTGIPHYIKGLKQDYDTQQQSVPLKKAYMIEVPCKLITYGCLAWTTIIIVPNIWLYLGII